MNEPRYVSSTEFQRSVGGTLYRVYHGGETIIVTAHGRPQTVCLPKEEYDYLRRCERQLNRERAAHVGNLDGASGDAPGAGPKDGEDQRSEIHAATVLERTV